MNNIKWILLGAYFFTMFYGYAQADIETKKQKDSVNILGRIKYDVKQTWNGVKYAYSRPAHWQKDDFIKAGAIVLSTAALYTVDEQTLRFFERQEPDVPNIIKDFGWYYGSPQNNFFVSAGIYGYGLIAKDDAFRRAGVLIISSNIAAGVIQSLSKTFFGRARPGTEKGKDFFKMFSSEGAYHAFPSGHAILSFTISHSIAKQFDNFWLKSGIYAVGLIAPISRLWAGAHWLTDVTVGIALSYFTVNAIDDMLFDTKAYDVPDKRKKISWNLKIGPGGIGVVGEF